MVHLLPLYFFSKYTIYPKSFKIIYSDFLDVNTLSDKRLSYEKCKSNRNPFCAYHFENARFDVSSPGTGNKTRNIASSDPVSTARDFYNKLTLVGNTCLISGEFHPILETSFNFAAGGVMFCLLRKDFTALILIPGLLR